MCNAVLTTGGTVRVKELEVIAHAIAYRGRGIPYYRCQLPTSITCRVKWPKGHFTRQVIDVGN